MPRKQKYIILRAPHTRCQDANLDIHIGNTALEKIGSHSHEQSTIFLGLVIDKHGEMQIRKLFIKLKCFKKEQLEL